MIALTRDVARSIQDAELTYVDRERIDYALAVRQHDQYRRLLASLGFEVITLPADEGHPDCVFIEDTAVVLSDLAVITRPGAESRRGETKVVADALAPWRRLVHIEAPATLDGGDVLVLDERIYVGLSTRTNEAGIDQLRRLTGREVIPVPLGACLHLKSAVTRVAPGTLLMNPGLFDTRPFEGWKRIEVDPAEPAAGNALLVGGAIIHPTEYPGTRARLEEAGLTVLPVDQSELAKAEGGVTCSSLIVEPDPARSR